VTDHSVPAVIEMVDVELISNFLTIASETKLTKLDEVQEATRSLTFSKAPGPNGITNRFLKHFPSEWYHSWHRFSMRFSPPIASLQCGSTLE